MTERRKTNLFEKVWYLVEKGWFGFVALLGLVGCAFFAVMVLETVSVLFIDSPNTPPTMAGGLAANSACRLFVTDSLETPATAVFGSRLG